MGTGSTILPLWIGLVDRIEHIHTWVMASTLANLKPAPVGQVRNLVLCIRALAVLCEHAETRKGLISDATDIIERIDRANMTRTNDSPIGAGLAPDDDEEPQYLNPYKKRFG